MITYIARLQEEFGIPYIRYSDFNPENFYKIATSVYENFYDSPRRIREEDKKNIELLLKLIPKDKMANIFSHAIMYADGINKPEMVKFLEHLKLDSANWDL